eukprot:TRINITY_DN15718_c0_g1_i1.p1 TRINITY_DN15718_c0_g1~~TRINITY_DN15718_c0_g1_i1.p1  ORF type:complete len:361 (-),score=113.35 TRINITY_DN15718_c0_g1_i1:110-1192(-)
MCIRDSINAEYGEHSRNKMAQTEEAVQMNHIEYVPGCDAEGLVLGSSLRPSPGPGEVLIKVAFAGVGGTDLAQRRGNFNPKPGSPAHHAIMGLEISGTVHSLGEGVDCLEPGARVCALLYGGGYASWAVVPVEQVLELPESISLEQGAALPENYWTVWANVFSQGFGNMLRDGQTLLVHGGAGGIGSTAIAMAKSFGKTVLTTVSSQEKADAVKSWGADHAIDYTKVDFVDKVHEITAGAGVDVVLCFVGGDYLPRNVQCLANHGRLVQIGLRGGKDVAFDIKVLMHKWGKITGGHLRPRSTKEKGELRDCLREHVLPKLVDGTLVAPTIHAVLPLARASEAHHMLETGQVIGKIILNCE